MNYPSRGRTGDRGSQATIGADPLDEKTVKGILDGNAELLVYTAERLGRDLKDGGLTTAQIRGIFGTVRRIELSWPRTGADSQVQKQKATELLMLRPRLAYQAARYRNEVGPLERALRPLIDGVRDDRERFQRFVDFFEAIVAYHRFAGGR